MKKVGLFFILVVKFFLLLGGRFKGVYRRVDDEMEVFIFVNFGVNLDFFIFGVVRYC